MSEETVSAGSSAAEGTQEKFTQFTGWDEDGNPVVTRKPGAQGQESAESASADASKETEPDDAADSAAKKQQEERHVPRTEKRIKELASRVKQLEGELEDARKPKKTEAESSPARQPEPKAPQQEPTRPKPSQTDKGPDGKPKYASYEDFVEDLADWKAEQRMAAREAEQRQRALLEQTTTALREAQARYPDFMEKAKPLVQELNKGDANEMALNRLNRSPHLADVLYAIGGSEESAADFLAAMRADPSKAIEVIVLMEQEIARELGKGGQPNGKRETVQQEAPPAKNPRAPKPPAEVGGRGAAQEDALASAAKSGDFRSFAAEQTRRALASRR